MVGTKKRILSGALGQPACGLKDHASLTLILSLLDCQRLARPGSRRSEKWAFRRERPGSAELGLGLHSRQTTRPPLAIQRRSRTIFFLTISLVFGGAGHQIKAAAICPLSLIARLWVVLVEMSFSLRVHPAPFSPTPNRHAGIGLKL